jgi:hypothetical protein
MSMPSGPPNVSVIMGPIMEASMSFPAGAPAICRATILPVTLSSAWSGAVQTANTTAAAKYLRITTPP